ncbi:AaceriAER158Cp [[Ashbya] aceris (nom. inval.)]|nr:AaceriAER158Cp [[Ashbya] aceris (nom. inval.)]
MSTASDVGKDQSGKLVGRALFERIGKPTKIVAPMVDQSELAWRILSRRYGATLAYTPMLHAKLFATSEKYRRDMWCDLDGDEKIDRPLIVQFCANDPEYLLKAAQLVEDKCDAVDLNLGCPQGIAKKGHYGSFLMEEWDLVSELINTLHKKLAVPVTAKIRIFPEKEKTLAYAKMVLDAGAQFLTVHGRLREQKGQQTGLADWATIKYLRDNLPSDTVFFANGNILYPEDIPRCMTELGCDAVMSAEGNLYNPGIFNTEYIGDKEKTFPRVDKVLREYFEIVKEHSCSAASRTAMKNHFFKILRPFLPIHVDIRAQLAQLSPKHPFEEWEKVVAAVELAVSDIFAKRDIDAKDVITTDAPQAWGGAYKTVPYWRCQPYFRPVNGVTADKRVTLQYADNGDVDVASSAPPAVKRDADQDLESNKRKELRKEPAST